jgi:hypothetical protein
VAGLPVTGPTVIAIVATGLLVAIVGAAVVPLSTRRRQSRPFSLSVPARSALSGATGLR